MTVVELVLKDNEAVYVNPLQVTRLMKAAAPDSATYTEIFFAGSDKIVVKGDIDYIAFQLFPTGAR
ncbi:MAG TPA: hypothetical protein VNT30_25920 [Stellaceae bacterium]|nr:hypothetical protein [Stellaceae bacterium]